MNNKVIANFVKTERKKANLNQKELANIAGVHWRTVQNIEANKPVGEEMIETVCIALGYQPIVEVKMVKIKEEE